MNCNTGKSTDPLIDRDGKLYTNSMRIKTSPSSQISEAKPNYRLHLHIVEYRIISKQKD